MQSLSYAPVHAKVSKMWPLLKNFKVAREDQKRKQRTVVPGCDKYCRGSEHRGSIMGPGPSRGRKLWLESSRCCWRGFRWNGTSQGLGAGTSFLEGLGGSLLGRRVEVKAENMLGCFWITS